MIDIFSNNCKNINGLKYIDLFAGIGGFRLALDSFGAKCVFTSEWDKYAQDVYFKNFGNVPEGDITKIEATDIPKHDILCGGFPCQAFSISGNQKGFNDIRGTLFFDISRILKYHRPKVFLLENVANFEKHDNGKTLAVVLRTFHDLDYRVHYKVLNASMYGVPHKRQRIYFVGFHKSTNITAFNFPSSINKSVKMLDITSPDNETKEFIINRDDIYFNNKSINLDIFGNYPQRPIRIGTVNKGGQGERIYHESGHSITLSAYGGGVGAKTGLYSINGKIRKLAPRECARLLGLPESFVLSPSNNQAYKQFGNGVVVDVLQYILIEINRSLQWIGQNLDQKQQRVDLEMKRRLSPNSTIGY